MNTLLNCVSSDVQLHTICGTFSFTLDATTIYWLQKKLYTCKLHFIRSSTCKRTAVDTQFYSKSLNTIVLDNYVHLHQQMHTVTVADPDITVRRI